MCTSALPHQRMNPLKVKHIILRTEGEVTRKVLYAPPNEGTPIIQLFSCPSQPKIVSINNTLLSNTPKQLSKYSLKIKKMNARTERSARNNYNEFSTVNAQDSSYITQQPKLLRIRRINRNNVHDSFAKLPHFQKDSSIDCHPLNSSQFILFPYLSNSVIRKSKVQEKLLPHEKQLPTQRREVYLNVLSNITLLI